LEPVDNRDAGERSAAPKQRELDLGGDILSIDDSSAKEELDSSSYHPGLAYHCVRLSGELGSANRRKFRSIQDDLKDRNDATT
jgi:hypothetical protein